MAQTVRDRKKKLRRTQILNAAALLFARQGFSNVSLEELGASAGVSGPAVYRYFKSKDAVLAELLIAGSKRTTEGGEAAVAGATTDQGALKALVNFHTDLVIRDRDMFQIQDRDISRLSPPDAAKVRALQRSYVALWVSVLSRIQPELSAGLIRTKVQATFGLLNSTPHSTSRGGDLDISKKLLAAMAMAALLVKPRNMNGASKEESP
jgi:AcrR family transcriptional regulator